MLWQMADSEAKLLLYMLFMQSWIVICDRLRQKQAFGEKISFADFFTRVNK